MRRTQLFMDEDLWETLHLRARQSGTTVSELVRQAVRDKYAVRHAQRREAMQAFAGLWKDRPGLPATETYVHRLRRGKRLKRIQP